MSTDVMYPEPEPRTGLNRAERRRLKRQGGEKVVYCTKCEMWYKEADGPYYKRYQTRIDSAFIPICPVCSAPLAEIGLTEFKKANANRWDKVETWEYPKGSFWEIKAGETRTVTMPRETNLLVQEKPEN